MPRTFQYQALAAPIESPGLFPAPAGEAAVAYQLPDPPRFTRRLTVGTEYVGTIITPAVVAAPTGTAAFAYQLPDPPRPVRRLTAEPPAQFGAEWPNIPARPAVPGICETTFRNEEVPHRLPRFVQDPPTRYVPQPLDSAPPVDGWGTQTPDVLGSRKSTRDVVGGSIIAPVTPRTEPTAAQAVVWARLPEVPGRPGRVPQPGGTMAPDVSNDRPIYAWQRALPELPTRARPRLTDPTNETTPLRYPRLPLEWNRSQETPGPVRRRSQLGPVNDGPYRQSVPLFFASEPALPKLTGRRLPVEGFRVEPLVRDVPRFFQAETVTPTFRKRLVPEPAYGFIPPRHVTPVYVPVPMETPPAPRRRVRFEPGETRMDPTGPAVPPLVWFVAHEMPRRLQQRWAFESYAEALDPGLDLLLPDDRQDPTAAADPGQSVLGG